MAVDAYQWALAVLRAGGWPQTSQNIEFLQNWLPREGTAAENNPMATTQGGYAGETQFNSVGVKNYPDLQEGVDATVQTLNENYYPQIAAALRAGNAMDVNNSGALAGELQTWSGSGYTSVPATGSPTYQSPGLANTPLTTVGPNTPGGAPPAGAAGAVTPGTQVQVPGTVNAGGRGTASPALAAPGDVTAGSTTSIQYPQGENAAAIPQLPGNANWAETEAYIRKNYPSYSWLLDIKGPNNPATVIQQAVQGGWDSARLQGAIAQTDWWKTTSNSLRQFQQNKATNPGDLDFNVKGSSAQQKLGDIMLAAKNAGYNIPKGLAQNLATEALMYGWDSSQVQENIATVIGAGGGQVYSPGYESGVAQNPGEYNIGNGKPTGPVAATAITTVRNAIAGQGYNVKDFNTEDVDNLAQEYMKFGWSPQQLAAAVIKVGAGGTAYQLSPTYTQGLVTNPEQYSFGDAKTGEKPGTLAQQALTAVRNAIASAGKTVGGKGGISDAQVQNLAQESMMFGWNSQQLTQNINSLGKGGGLLSPSYLQGLITNAQEYQPGGQQYNQAASAVKGALASAGKSKVGKMAVDALTEEYLQQGWTPEQLTLAVGQMKGSGAISSQYLVQQQANPTALQAGGYLYQEALAAVKGAVSGAGLKNISPTDENALVQQYLMQGWTEGSQALTQAVGQLKTGSTYSQAYTTGIQQNPREYEPGGSQYLAAQSAVQGAIQQAGVRDMPQADIDRLVQGYLQQGWTGQTLLEEVGMLASTGRPYSQAYTTGYAQNPTEYQPGGTAYTQAENEVLNAVRSQGVSGLTQDDLNQLVEGVLQFGWDPTTLSNEVGAVAHKGAPYNPAYLTGLAANPLEYDFTNPSQNKGVQTTADQVLTQVEIVAAQQGVNLRPVQAQEVARRAMQSGGNNPPDSLIQSLLAPMVSVQGNTPQESTGQAPGTDTAGGRGVQPVQPTTGNAANPGLGAQTNAPALLQQLRTQATNYLVTLPDNVYQQWAQQIAGGTQTMQQFEAYLAQHAAEKYPGMAQQIQQGQTPSQVAGGLTTLASQTLEIQPDQVNYLNPQYQKLLTGGYNLGPNNTQIPNNMMMTQTQAGDYLRRLPQFAQTTNAKTLAAQAVTDVLQDWGRVG